MTAIIIIRPVLMVTKPLAKPRLVTTLGVEETISECLRCYGDSFDLLGKYQLNFKLSALSLYLSESDFGSKLSDM